MLAMREVIKEQYCTEFLKKIKYFKCRHPVTVCDKSVHKNDLISRTVTNVDTNGMYMYKWYIEFNVKLNGTHWYNAHGSTSILQINGRLQKLYNCLTLKDIGC